MGAEWLLVPADSRRTPMDVRATLDTHPTAHWHTPHLAEEGCHGGMTLQRMCVDAASGSTHKTLLISRTGVISFVESFHTSAIDATPILDAPSLFFRRASAASLLVDKDYEARVAFLALRTLGIVITKDCERSVLARLRAVAKVREATAIHPAPLAPPTHEDNDQQDEILGAVVPSSSSHLHRDRGNECQGKGVSKH